MDISTISNALKLPKKAYFLGMVISGILLLSEESFLKKLSLFDFKENYKIWVGVVFLLSIGMSLIIAIEFLFNQYKESKLKKEIQKQKDAEIHDEKIKKEQEVNRKKLILKNLDNYEKAILREFAINKKNTIEMSFEDPTVIGLAKKGVIRQVGNHGYTSNITGGIAYFKADDLTVEFFESLDFTEINGFPRPLWIEGLKAKEALDKNIASLGKSMQNF